MSGGLKKIKKAKQFAKPPARRAQHSGKTP